MNISRIYVLILGLLPLLAIQCSKESGTSQTLKEDHLVFGYINCFDPSAVDCIRLFLLQDGQLYADAIQRPEQSLTFHSEPLSAEDFQRAIKAWTDFPAQLWQQPNTQLGCPNCLDQGILLVSTVKNGIPMRWELDPIEAALPLEIRPYAALLKEILEELP
jgi:hypothetical protein